MQVFFGTQVHIFPASVGSFEPLLSSSHDTINTYYYLGIKIQKGFSNEYCCSCQVMERKQTIIVFPHKLHYECVGNLRPSPTYVGSKHESASERSQHGVTSQITCGVASLWKNANAAVALVSGSDDWVQYFSELRIKKRPKDGGCVIAPTVSALHFHVLFVCLA